METVVAFRIWYSDHSEVGYTYEDWKALPSTDVQGVVLFTSTTEPDGSHHKTISSGNDKYAITQQWKIYDSQAGTRVYGSAKDGAWTDWDNLMRIEAEMYADTGGWING